VKNQFSSTTWGYHQDTKRRRKYTTEERKEKQQKLISISPTTKGENIYQIIPRSVIGVIELATKVLIIQPKISVSNILFLLCYTWEPLEWK
jgi:hypothetical protein